MGTATIPRVGFLGAGQMATALARGWCQAGIVQCDQVLASDPSGSARDAFVTATRAKATSSNREVVAYASLVVLAVKPQTMANVLADVRDVVTPGHLIVSIAAGVSIQQLKLGLAGKGRIIRVMPNTPCLVGASASGFCPDETASTEDVSLVAGLLAAVGKAVQVQEHLLDAVTGLSGSGPAYVFVMIEALSDGGVRMGLPRDVATMLAAQTVYGAAKLLMHTGEHPAALKDKVASPGGTTIAGLHALEQGGMRAALMNAVKAATERSRELGAG